MLERFRQFWTNIWAPLANLFIRWGISPNTVTFVGTVGVVAGAVIFFPMGKLLAGVLVITAQETRSQERNREIALQKLVDLLRKAAHRPKRRIATKPTRASKTRRLDSKSKHAKTKRLRSSRPDAD